MNNNNFDEAVQRGADLTRYLEKKEWDEYREKLSGDEIEKMKSSDNPNVVALYENMMLRMHGELPQEYITENVNNNRVWTKEFKIHWEKGGISTIRGTTIEDAYERNNYGKAEFDVIERYEELNAPEWLRPYMESSESTVYTVHK